MIEPQYENYFEEMLEKFKFKFHVVVDDVKKVLEQDEGLDQRLSRISGLGQVTFNSYIYYAEQMVYLHRLGRDYPETVTILKLGESYEGRNITAIRLSSGPSTDPSKTKPVIFIDAGIHCREWIAPAVALYIIQQLVENPENVVLYQNVDWVIVPNLNPDGYEYTQREDRLWRKNRRPNPNPYNNCIGTDLNRNFDHYWLYAGASLNRCSDIYAGPDSFSESESRAIRDYFLANGETIKLYLSFHSYVSMVLYPWGYAPTLPEDHEELQRLGELAADAIHRSTTINSRYTVNTSFLALGPGAGGSDDWVKGVANVSLSYCFELPHGDSVFPFLFPARQLPAVVKETFEAIKVYHQYIENKFWKNNNQ
ncbi:unnamed protein product [Ceutorhynchus assimilis]|uniref:Peptidase M14 domain-containing protein n=1 Tax=Ceutorhynchus assimilis TaxID=467358 RepID=A0A9N9MPX8_9CUCU|nr:unnamed protein product [Ceutorhynchus assimilis]